MAERPMPRAEVRSVERPVERREATDDQPTQITGYAALFDTPATIGGAWVEQIDRGAFDDALGDDVRVLFNHDPSRLLGRTASGTASIAVDETGLRYTVTPPDTATGREVLELLQRGDVSGSSFGFQVLADRWTEGTTSADLPVRHLERVTLIDVSPVTMPAYVETTAEARGQAFELSKHQAQLDAATAQRRLRLAQHRVE